MGLCSSTNYVNQYISEIHNSFRNQLPNPVSELKLGAYDKLLLPTNNNLTEWELQRVELISVPRIDLESIPIFNLANHQDYNVRANSYSPDEVLKEYFMPDEWGRIFVWHVVDKLNVHYVSCKVNDCIENPNIQAIGSLLYGGHTGIVNINSKKNKYLLTCGLSPLENIHWSEISNYLEPYYGRDFKWISECIFFLNEPLRLPFTTLATTVINGMVADPTLLHANHISRNSILFTSPCRLRYNIIVLNLSADRKCIRVFILGETVESSVASAAISCDGLRDLLFLRSNFKWISTLFPFKTHQEACDIYNRTPTETYEINLMNYGCVEGYDIMSMIPLSWGKVNNGNKVNIIGILKLISDDRNILSHLAQYFNCRDIVFE